MSIVTNTFTTFDAVGIREELSDVIYNISPEDTPFMSRAGKGPALKTTFFEWQTDALTAASSSNQQLQGDDITTFDAVTPTVRLGNYANISRKTLIISDTEEVVDKAGRDSELAYQMALRSAEIKRDMEKAMLDNIPAAAGSTSTKRISASLLAFVKTNVDKDAGGNNPSYTNIPTDTRDDGTQRTFTEDMLKSVISLCWAEGAKPSVIMAGAFNKKKVSSFTGIADRVFNMNAPKVAAIIGAADVYVSDFGTLTVIPNRFQRARDVHILDFDYIKVRYLRGFRTVKLAKTGDAEKRMLLAEWGLQVGTEKAIGLVADLTTS